jgi:hypothetical protein
MTFHLFGLNYGPPEASGFGLHVCPLPRFGYHAEPHPARGDEG